MALPVPWFTRPPGSLWASPRSEYVEAEEYVGVKALAVKWSAPPAKLRKMHLNGRWDEARELFQAARIRTASPNIAHAEHKSVEDYTRWLFVQKAEAPRRHARLARVIQKAVQASLLAEDGRLMVPKPGDLARLASAFRVAVEVERMSLGLDRAGEGQLPPGVEELLGEVPALPGEG